MYFPWWECIDEDGSMSFHWYDEDGSMNCHWYMMHSWCIWCIVEKMYRWLIIVLSWLIRCKNGWTQKWSPYGEALTGRCFADWVILEEWLEDPYSHYCIIMIDKVHKWMNSKVVPLWWNSREDVLRLSYPWRMVGEPMFDCGIMWWRSMKLLVKLSYHFRWYVECHITPHGLRFMALQRWRTPTWRLEAPKVKEVKVT